MPLSYRHYACEDVPDLEIDGQVRSMAQLALPWGTEQAHSALRYLGVSEHSDFLRYECIHQTDKEIDAQYRDEHIRRLVFNVRFTAYYNRTGKYFLVQTGKSIARDYFARMAGATPGIEAKAGRLDLDRVQDMGHTTGAWFGKLKIDRVTSAAIFGTEEIVQSDEWARYSEVGVISALHMHVQDRAGVSRAVMVTKDRLVLVMQQGNERDNLELVAYLNELFDDIE